MHDLQKLVSDYKPKYLYNKNFVPGKDQVLYSGPYWDEEEIAAAINTLLTGKWLVSGENVHKFESQFSKKFSVGHSHMVNSGSSSNLVMITGLKKYFNWEDGSEIIVSPVGFPTTVSPLIQNNLKPVFVDIEYDTLNFDLKLIESKITDKTKAIFVSPVLGNPPDMDYLKELSEKYNLKLIGDSCDTLGTKWKGEDINKFYVAWSTSFYPAHHITTGEGGMISTDIKELKQLFVSISWWGRDCYCVGSANLLSCGTCGRRFDNWLEKYNGVIDHKYVFTNIGYNLKPLDLQGSMGLVQLSKFDEIDKNRKFSKNKIQEIVTKYVKGVRSVSQLDNSETCWFGTPFVCESKELKTKLVDFLEKNKIQTRNYFAGNILIHPAFEHLDNFENYPMSNRVLDEVFFLGASPHYNDEVFNYIENVFETKWVN
jgi:CDP-6-deoxy-D-xylo-4-hexulose-3-dehydrase